MNKGLYIGSIAKYHRDELDGLSEKDIYFLHQKYLQFCELEQARESTIKKMTKEGTLTDSLQKQIQSCLSLQDLDALYKPFRVHNNLRVVKARKQGLEVFADWVWSVAQGDVESEVSAEVEAKKFTNPKEGLLTYSDVLKSTESLLTLKLISNHELRVAAEKAFTDQATLKVEKGRRYKVSPQDDRLLNRTFKASNLHKSGNYAIYAKLSRLWRMQRLKLVFDFEASKILERYGLFALKKQDASVAAFMNSVIKTAWEGHIFPSITQDFHRKQQALMEEAFTNSFSHVLNGLLSTKGVSPEITLVAVVPTHPLDKKGAQAQAAPQKEEEVPAKPKEKEEVQAKPKEEEEVPAKPKEEEGSASASASASTSTSTSTSTSSPPHSKAKASKNVCELALVDAQGRFMSSTQVEIGSQEAQKRAAFDLIKSVQKETQVHSLVLQRNSPQFKALFDFFSKLLQDQQEVELKIQTPYVFGVAGFLQSDEAKTSFQDLSNLSKKALYVAWFAQDPLKALLHVPLKGMTFSLLSSEQLEAKASSLKEVLRRHLFQVGVDMNTASKSMLCYLPGVSPELAQAIVQSRKEAPFTEREHIRRVPGVTSEIFTQCGDFLYVTKSRNKLAETRIPSSLHQPLKDITRELGLGIDKLVEDPSVLEKNRRRWQEILGGACTYEAVVSELSAPRKDPRAPYKSLDTSLHKIADVQPGKTLSGFVKSITFVGVFVDLGCQTLGFIRSSELFSKGVKNPFRYFTLGSQRHFKVAALDKSTGQISLTLSGGVGGSPNAKTKRERFHKVGAKDSAVAAARSGKKGPKGPHQGRRPSKEPSQRDFKGPKKKQAFNNPFESLKDLENLRS